MFSSELAEEAATLRKFFERVPADQFGYAPHLKSMKMGELCNHLADIVGWPALILATEALDFANPYPQPDATDSAQLVSLLDVNLNKSLAALNAADAAVFEQPWLLRNGEVVLHAFTKGTAIRHALSQITHHRAQLGVYLRLLEVPIPGSYGPSADEQGPM